MILRIKDKGVKDYFKSHSPARGSRGSQALFFFAIADVVRLFVLFCISFFEFLFFVLLFCLCCMGFVGYCLPVSL